MDEQRLEHFRAILVELRQELRASLESSSESTDPVSPDRAIGRLTRQNAMLAQQMALELKISLNRLDVRPEAPFCVHCAGSPRRS